MWCSRVLYWGCHWEFNQTWSTFKITKGKIPYRIYHLYEQNKWIPPKPHVFTRICNMWIDWCNASTLRSIRRHWNLYGRKIQKRTGLPLYPHGFRTSQQKIQPDSFHQLSRTLWRISLELPWTCRDQQSHQCSQQSRSGGILQLRQPRNL